LVNHSEIYTALQSLLDSDITLNDLLDRQSDSKIFIGIMPGSFGRPAIQVVIMTDNQRDTAHNLSDIVFLINVHSQTGSSGEGQMSQSADILDRCAALIDDQSLTVTGHSVYVMYVDGHNPIVNDSYNDSYAIEGIRCRMFAAK